MTGDDKTDGGVAGGGLAARQAALVAALVAAAPLPDGFDPARVGAARAALLRKRAGEVARHWPMLVAGLGQRWPAVFHSWAAGRPGRGALRDGWDLARTLHLRGQLPGLAAEEFTFREARFRYHGDDPPRPRRLPAVSHAGGAIAVQVAGRVCLLRRAAPLTGTLTRRPRGGRGGDAEGSRAWI